MFKKLISKKHKGWSFISSALVGVLTTVFVTYFLIMRYQIEVINQNVEDSIASSVLASSLIDLDRYAITNELFIISDSATFTVKESMDLFMRIFSKNEKLTICADKYGELTGASNNPFYDFSDEKRIRIEEYYVYNVPNEDDNGDQWGYYYFFKDGHFQTGPLVNYKTGNVLTPIGDVVTETSVYTNLSIPFKIRFFGIKAEVNKAQTVAIIYN